MLAKVIKLYNILSCDARLLKHLHLNCQLDNINVNNGGLFINFFLVKQAYISCLNQDRIFLNV